MTRAHAWFCQPRAADDARAIVTDLVRSKAGPKLARSFVANLETSLDRLIEQPDAGPRCTFVVHRLRDIRMWPIRSFPTCLVYYVASDDRIEIVRIVQGARGRSGS